MFTSTRLLYIVGAVVCGGAAGGYVAWAIASRFARIAELNDRAIIEPHVLIVLCLAGGMLAAPLGAAAGLVAVTVCTRLADYLKRSGSRGGADDESWVTRRTTGDGTGTE